jgi:general secretion pathway protein I
MTGGRGGFTLLEVMIALAIIAVSLVSLLSAHNRALTMLARAEALTKVTMLAREEMERVILRPPVEPGMSERMYREEESPYRWRVEARPTPFEGTLEVILTVFAADDEEETQSLVELRSYMGIK